jgi:antitoxin YefM
MINITSVNQFRENLKSYIDQVINDHIPLKVTRRNGDDFMVVSVEDWEREQETLYILQNNSLMEQIAQSQVTHTERKGYRPTQEQIDEILDF